MAEALARLLQQTIDGEVAHLRQLTDAETGVKSSPNAWSRKEELGHLIDSASNNHQRFVRAAIGPESRGPGYQQDAWVACHGYNEMPWEQIVDFWLSYNRFLAMLVRRIPDHRLEAPCFIGDHPAATLGFVIDDYVLHMRHHLDHILRREKITPYPRAAAV
jgi:hypothetical protein